MMGARFFKNNITTSILLDKRAHPTFMVDYNLFKSEIKTKMNTQSSSLFNDNLETIQNNNNCQIQDTQIYSNTMSLIANSDSFSIFHTLKIVNYYNFNQNTFIGLYSTLFIPSIWLPILIRESKKKMRIQTSMIHQGTRYLL